MSHSSPSDSLTFFLHLFRNSFGSSLHNRAASTFAGLSSFGLLSIEMTDSNIVSGDCTGDHLSDTDSYPMGQHQHGGPQTVKLPTLTIFVLFGRMEDRYAHFARGIDYYIGKLKPSYMTDCWECYCWGEILESRTSSLAADVDIRMERTVLL
jgi:hypothetical protein